MSLHIDTTEGARTWDRAAVRRVGGLAAACAGAMGWATWLTWRSTHLDPHPLAFGLLGLETAGLAAGLLITAGLARSRAPRRVHAADRRETYRFAFAVADVVGRTRATDLQRDLRDVVRMVGARGPRHTGDLALAATILEGPRRLTMVVVVVLALFLGVPLVPVPPVWALVALAVGVIGIATSHVRLGRGRIRYGDRLRWSYATIGELLWRDDAADLAPRRWVGTVAAAVVLNLAIALRGMSDRWTHGLVPMDDAERRVALVLAIALVLGALYSLTTMSAPDLANAHLVSRRLEERTARQSALGTAVVVGLIGLVAGVLPGGVDATDDDPGGIEQISDRDTGTELGARVSVAGGDVGSGDVRP
jgi:hypothetical protein